MSDELDKEIQQLATTDWKQFMEIIGPDFVIQCKARILRRKGKSYQQISVKLAITPAQARYACNGKNKADKI